jgi:hypothetical protein
MLKWLSTLFFFQNLQGDYPGPRCHLEGGCSPPYATNFKTTTN